MSRPSIAALQSQAAEGQRLVMVTCYDYASARIIDRTSIPLVLVGDSLGMVSQGGDSTLHVTVDDIVYHTRAVVRGATRQLVVADLPFMSYATEPAALSNAARLLAEGGAHSVKLEGGVAVAPTVRRLVELGVPVMGHLGFTPQSVNLIGTRVQAKSATAATALLRDALALQAAGAWAIVLELVPRELAAAVTAKLDIPTIGIGAGVDCNGEVQVWHDVLGLYDDFVPRHTKRYRSLSQDIAEALEELASDVRSRSFPEDRNSASVDSAVITQALAALEK
jgi:3-methyl-2-oxobutanoate hydroxymethyltransferase